MRLKRSAPVVLALLSPLAAIATAGAQPQPPEEPPAEAPPPQAPPAEAPPAGAALTPEEEAALAAEEEALGPDPARPPPAGKGVVWGVVSESISREPLLDAQITVVGTKYKAIADIDGRFRLELPPGSYELRVWYEVHQARRVQNVRVAGGKVLRVDVALDPDKTAEEVIEIEAAPDRATAAAQLLLRRNAAHVGDAVSAQEIARTPDRNAADAARRVVGATVVGGKYVFVRGLGDRYTNALLNGTPLPSPEPDRQAVPLDLFPSLILADITIAKTFTPDMPGDFAGGSVRITTREIPEKFQVQVTLSAGLNTESSFADRLTYRGSSTDWLGVDGGARALPAEIPDYKVIRLGAKPDGTMITGDELTFYGRKINAFMSTQTTRNLPNLSGSAVIGDTFKFGDGQQLGVMAALNYGRRFTTRSGEILRTFAPDEDNPGQLRRLNDYTAETGLDQVSWGGLASVGYRPGKDHQVSFTGFHSRSSDNEARVISGPNEEAGGDSITDTRLRFISRSLTFGQLRGQHTIRPAAAAILDWNLSLSHATADEPDTRETVYRTDAASGITSWDDGTLSGSHFFADQREDALGGGLDWTQPITRGDAPKTVKFGGLFSARSRSFDARRFRFTPRSVNPEVFRSPPDQLFTDDNIGTALALEEFTRANDAYDAEQRVLALYAMADLALTKRFRVILGERLESSLQSIDSFDPFAVVDAADPDRGRVKAELETADFLPSVGAVLKVTPESNLRASVARTVARPQLRELAPYLYTPYFGARDILGNPELNRTSIYHGDLRFEWFPSPGDVLALSLFYKQFYDAIEQVIIPTSGRGAGSYANAAAARNVGGEIEVRKNLGFLATRLEDLSLLGNVTLVSSRVDLGADAVGVQTNRERPLAGQSPFVINLGIDFASESLGTRARLLYNVFGERIAQVGALGLPDELEQPRHQLDLTVAQRVGKHVDVKVTAENLLNSPVRFTQGDDTGDESVTNEYKTGTTVTLSLTVNN